MHYILRMCIIEVRGQLVNPFALLKGTDLVCFLYVYSVSCHLHHVFVYLFVCLFVCVPACENEISSAVTETKQAEMRCV